MIKSPSGFVATLSALVIACAMAAFTAQPAAAQTAKKLKCNGCIKSKQIKNNGIKGIDIGPGINLGTSRNDGDFSVRNTAGTSTVSLDGDTGNVSNSFSGNGLAKAWAQIASDGQIIACWRCNRDTAETLLVSTGLYHVDFTPIAPDITGRPRSAVLDTNGQGTTGGQIGLATVFGDESSVWVNTYSLNGTAANLPFTVIIY